MEFFFLLIFQFFTRLGSQNTDFSSKKSEIMLFKNKLKLKKKKKKTRHRYLVIYVKKECAKFQKDRFSRFSATEFTGFEKAKCEKITFKIHRRAETYKCISPSVLLQLLSNFHRIILRCCTLI